MTTNDLYLITAATGKTGADAVRILREDGQRVRALVHTRDARAEALAGLAPRSSPATCSTSLR
jgi:NAD(P)H dehydrogenase (quinone)